MKNFKQIAFGLLVGALAISFSAFTNAHSTAKGKFAMQWFQLKSTVTNDKTHALVSSNYNAPTDNPPCSAGSTYCGVEANNVGGQPDLSSGTTANTQINAYFNTGTQGSQISAEDQ